MRVQPAVWQLVRCRWPTPAPDRRLPARRGRRPPDRGRPAQNMNAELSSYRSAVSASQRSLLVMATALRPVIRLATRFRPDEESRPNRARRGARKRNLRGTVPGVARRRTSNDLGRPVGRSLNETSQVGTYVNLSPSQRRARQERTGGAHSTLTAGACRSGRRCRVGAKIGWRRAAGPYH